MAIILFAVMANDWPLAIGQPSIDWAVPLLLRALYGTPSAIAFWLTLLRVRRDRSSFAVSIRSPNVSLSTTYALDGKMMRWGLALSVRWIYLPPHTFV